MTPKFASPRFDYSEMIKEYDDAEIGDVITVRSCVKGRKQNSEQASLCNLLRAKGLKPGKDAQTCVQEDILFIRKLSTAQMG